jgi:hypothetical protein
LSPSFSTRARVRRERGQRSGALGRAARPVQPVAGR